MKKIKINNKPFNSIKSGAEHFNISFVNLRKIINLMEKKGIKVKKLKQKLTIEV